MDREQLWEQRKYRDYRALKRDIFGVFCEQCEIVRLLEEVKQPEIQNSELKQEWDNLYDCIKDCAQELWNTKVDFAFCNGIYQETVIICQELLPEEYNYRRNQAKYCFAATENDYLVAEYFHIMNFFRMEDIKRRDALERYYEMLKYRWGDSKETSNSILAILLSAIFFKNIKQYYSLFNQYNSIFLKHLYDEEEYGDGLYFMVIAASINGNEKIIRDCISALKLWIKGHPNEKEAIMREIQLINADLVLDGFNKDFHSLILKCRYGIKKAEQYLEQEKRIFDNILFMLHIQCSAAQILFLWDESFEIVQKGLNLCEITKKTDRNIFYWLFKIRLGTYYVMTEKLDDAYIIFKDIVDGGNCKNLDCIQEANCMLATIAIMEGQFTEACDICREQIKKIPEIEENYMVLSVLKFNYLSAATAESVEMKGEYYKIYKWILDIGLSRMPNDRLRIQTKLIYGRYQLRFGENDESEFIEILKEAEAYLNKIPKDYEVRKIVEDIYSHLSLKA